MRAFVFGVCDPATRERRVLEEGFEWRSRAQRGESEERECGEPGLQAAPWADRKANPSLSDAFRPRAKCRLSIHLKININLLLGLAWCLGSFAAAAPTLNDVITKLNTVPRPPADRPSPFTQAIDDDLIAVYQRELEAASDPATRALPRPERNRRLHERMAAGNRQVREKLAAASDGAGAQRAKAIAERIYRRLATNAVAKVDAAARYDRFGDIGFCFGRAAMAHYLLLRAGVKPDRIAKIFVVGRLKYGEQLWDFHVATMIMGDKGRWWVIDPLFENILPHDAWMDRAAAFDIKPNLPQLRFYVTDPRKFQPAFGSYRARFFRLPEVKRYFADLVRTLKK